MAEQDIYASNFGGKSVPLDKIADKLPLRAGAEQEIYGSHFRPDFGHAHSRNVSGPTSHVRGAATTNVLGLLQTTVLPSFGLHVGFSAVAYGISRYTDRVEGKDWLWPAGITANAWWNAIGIHVVNDNLSVAEAWSHLDYSQKLLLAGVTAWGGRLLYRIATRSAKRGEDDPRYKIEKKEPGFWNKSFLTLFLPEALAQTVIALPLTLSLGAVTESGLSSPALSSFASLPHTLAVFLFSAGFTLETLADAQLDAHKQQTGDAGIMRDGVWSIVRHPNYLGDALIHASFPLILLGANLLHPLALVGPLANYLFLRFVGGDKQNEESQAERYSKSDPIKFQEFQDYQAQKNSFWPSLEELKNKWTLVVAAAGVGGVCLERALSAF